MSVPCRRDYARWPAIVLAAFLAAACAPGQKSGVDSWAVRRTLDGEAGTTSISEINLERPPATRALEPMLLREQARARWRVTVQVDAPLAKHWKPVTALLDPELDAALHWLSRIAASEPREVRLQVTLVGRDAQRRERRLHRVQSAVIIDLLVPVDAAPSSRSAAVAQALALALHEAVHALRGPADKDRDADEYRASLVNACYLLDVIRSGDTLNFSVAPALPGDDLARRHSRDAATKVMRDLRRVAGHERLDTGDTATLRKLRIYCVQRLQSP